MYQIKRWYLMLTGKSVWHVNQDIGKCFAKGEVTLDLSPTMMRIVRTGFPNATMTNDRFHGRS